jgi:hypothetical protein
VPLDEMLRRIDHLAYLNCLSLAHYSRSLAKFSPFERFSLLQSAVCVKL